MTQQAEQEQVANEVVEQHDEELNSQQGETPAQAEQESAAQGDEEAEVVITLGDDSPPSEGEDEAPAAAPAWVKELRRADREKARLLREKDAKIAEYEAKLAAANAPDSAPTAKPTLADCDYDEEVFEEKLDAWKEQDRSVKAKVQAEAEAKAKQQQEWEAKRTAYDSAKSSLKVADFDDAEDTLKATFSDMQQAVLLEAVDSADMQAKLVYALGNNLAELKRLAAITNPIKLGIAVAELEKKLKVTTTKKPPAPEKEISGRTTAVGVQDTKLARLQAEAARTGNMTELFAYQREQRRKEQG